MCKSVLRILEGIKNVLDSIKTVTIKKKIGLHVSPN